FLGNTEGLYGYSMQAKEYTQHYKDELPSPSVNQLALEDSNRLWVATQSGIVSVLDLQKKTFGEFSKNEIESNSILTNLIYSVYVDTEHRKWFGTSKGGV